MFCYHLGRLIYIQSPLLTGVLCSVFLKEPFTKQEIFAGLASLSGVLLIARPKSLFGRGSHDAISVGEESQAFSSEKWTMTVKPNVSESQRLLAVG